MWWVYSCLVKVKMLVTQSCPTQSCPTQLCLFVILWTVACQAPLSMEFSRQEYWSGLPCSSPGIFLIQGWNSDLLHCRQITIWATWEAWESKQNARGPHSFHLASTPFLACWLCPREAVIPSHHRWLLLFHEPYQKTTIQTEKRSSLHLCLFLTNAHFPRSPQSLFLMSH